MIRLTRLQKLILTAWLKLAALLHVPRNVRSGIAWAIGLPPMAGADDGDGDGGDAGDGDGDGGDDGDGDGWTPPTKAEVENLQRKEREAREERDRLKTAEADRIRKEAEKAGDHQAVIDAEKKRADDAEAERDKITAEREAERQERRVESIASRLKFKDPTDVLHRVPAEKRGNDADVERALKAVAKEKPYLLVDGDTPRTRDVTGDNAGGSGEQEPTGVARMARAYADSAK